MFVQGFLWIGGFMGGLVGLTQSGGLHSPMEMDLRDKFIEHGYGSALGLLDMGMAFFELILYVGGGILVGWIVGSFLAGLLLAMGSMGIHR